MFLEANDLRPQSVSFVGELSDSFSELVVVGDGSGGVGGIDETGVARRARYARIRSAFDAHSRGLPAPVGTFIGLEA